VVGWWGEEKTFTVVVMKYYTLPCTFATTPYYTLFNTFIYKMDINYLVCRVDGHARHGSNCGGIVPIMVMMVVVAVVVVILVVVVK